MQSLRAARPVPVPLPVSLNRHVSYAVTVPKPYPVAIPHPVSVPVPRLYPVTVPRPVAVPVPHPVPVVVPHPVGVPVPKPYPVPVPHPVPVPSSFLVGGGIPFEGLGGQFLSFGHGAGGHSSGVLLAVAGHDLTTGHGQGLSSNSFSHVPQLPLPLPGFEPLSGSDGNTPEASYNGYRSHQSARVEVPGSGFAPSLSYADSGKGEIPAAEGVVPSSRHEVPTPSQDGYPYSPA